MYGDTEPCIQCGSSDWCSHRCLSPDSAFENASAHSGLMRLHQDRCMSAWKRILSVEQGPQQAGFVEVRYGDVTLTVFCEDLVSKGVLLSY